MIDQKGDELMKAACKIIINGATRALSESLEKALTNPLVRGEMVPAEKCDELLDELSRIDLLCFNPATDTPPRTLLHIVDDLVKCGAVSDRVWEIYAKPAGFD